MNQFLGIKGKILYVVLLFAPLFFVPSLCSAANACISGTPILNVIAPNPSAPGGNVSYSVKAVGYGFATYEIRASDVGILRSGGFRSGQTVSGNYNTPSGSGLITFNIKDAGGNVIPNCFAKADMTLAQNECAANLRTGVCFYHGPRNFHVWANYVLYGRHIPQFWGTPVSYSVCFKCAPPIAHNFQVNSSNLGIVNSGSIVSSQMVVGSYSIAYGTNSESYAFTFPGSGWLTGMFRSWATSAPNCNATFSLSGALAVGSNIQLNANAANINGSRPDNYKWKVNGADYMQGSDKDIVSKTFSAGTHTILLTVDNGLGTSCSSNQTITIPVPPPVPSCSVTGITATPSTANFGTNVNFTANISGTGIVSYIWKDGATPLGTTVDLPGNGGAAANSHIFPGAANITKTITLVGTLSDGRMCQGNVSVNLTVPPLPPPLPCTVDFDVRNSTKSCLTSSCKYNEPISFFVSAASGPIIGYTWTMNKTTGGNEAFSGGINTGASVSKTFVPADGKDHNIHLAAQDSNGNTCTMDKTVNIKPSMPGWTEIAPYLLQLGPIGFLALLFLARIIFLRL